MIDYFCKWANEAAAKADAAMLANQFGVEFNNWRVDRVIPNVQVWRPSQDVGGVHTFLPGWFAVIGTANQLAALDSLAATQFVLNRDGPPYVIINNIGTIITDVAVSPIFAGSHYPIGGIA